MAGNKYGARKFVSPQYGTFDSIGEYERWQDLLLLQRAGVIVGLKRQVKYELIPTMKTPSGKTMRGVTYVADFRYYDSRKGEWITEDYKGFRTGEYKIKKKMMLAKYGIEVLETGRDT